MYYDYYGVEVEAPVAFSRMRGLGDLPSDQSYPTGLIYANPDPRDIVARYGEIPGSSQTDMQKASESWLSPKTVKDVFDPLVAAASAYSALRTEPHKEQLRRLEAEKMLRAQQQQQPTSYTTSPWTWIVLVGLGLLVVGGVFYASKKG